MNPPAGGRTPTLILAALDALLRGFTAAAPHALAAADPREVQAGLVTVLLRLAFLRSADDPVLAELPRTPDAWPQLLAHFERLHARHGGRLFAPDRAPFLRLLSPPTPHILAPSATPHILPPPPTPHIHPAPPLAAALPYAALDAALAALRRLAPGDPAPLALLGAVHEATLDLQLVRATGPSLALRPHHRLVDLAALLAEPPGARAARLREHGVVLTAPALAALHAADDLDAVLTALAGHRSPRTREPLLAGALYLQPGPARRRSGAHYTPQSLTHRLAAAALRPTLADLGDDPTPQQLLSLRICDPAMGCGAFLLAACEQLAPRLQAARARHEPTANPPPTASPDPPASRDATARRDLADAPSRPTRDELRARRDIAVHCLCGVDLDPVAVELARLSLGLFTAASDEPLAALDHALRHGDALVGLDRAQIAAFRWDSRDAGDSPPDPLPTFPPPDPAHNLTALRADAVLAAFFRGGSRPRERERARAALHQAADRAAHGDRDARAELHRRRDALRDGAPAIVAFHWPLEFPDVFARERPGFDVMLGNPPFHWGNRIGRDLGEAYREWLQQLHPGAHGNSDLAAHFLRRAFALLRAGGSLGFITTNSIAEAETRAAGLDAICRRGGHIYEATRDLPWPGAASVRVAEVCVRRGPLAGPRRLDGRSVPAIAGDLRPPRGRARPLRERTGQSFKGVDFGGTGFLLAPATRDDLLRDAPTEAAHIWPVLNAIGFTTSPELRPVRHIINFSGLTLAEASAAPRCLEILRRDVLPRRSRDRRPARRERWWIYNEACPGLYRAIAGLRRVLVGPVISKYILFGFVDPRVVFTNALNVFTFDDPAALAVLQSRIHELWALHHASSLRSDPRYNPTTCFETFPFPADWAARPALAAAGQAYDEHRAAVLRRNAEGLTATFNRLHDAAHTSPEIDRLRELHAAIDRAVLLAYGWDDLAARARCEFREARLGWPPELRDELLARLLDLNHRRPARTAAPPG